ncbi:MAG: 2-C-methyl-D-erythritol 2,4-cyclodiphosphate synthase [Spirochaetes bacterium]|jgi:2-C-methyl-D-erythritol 2,4-cyclodiphosphate synthase|nr:2-C-methyl-D-erythritol 2,4-cyclodiphosphate synthase [Spirochaetota bacterium]
MSNLRIGNGFDVHPFAKGRDLILGGEKIDSPLGLLGHSDADVLIHAIIDSLCGACGFMDIGSLFPDSNEKYRDVESIILLERIYEMINSRRIRIVNIDSVIICNEPKISTYSLRMKKNISKSIGNLELDRIGIKGKTTEGLGFTGRGEGIAVYSVSLIEMPL